MTICDERFTLSEYSEKMVHLYTSSYIPYVLRGSREVKPASGSSWVVEGLRWAHGCSVFEVE